MNVCGRELVKNTFLTNSNALRLCLRAFVAVRVGADEPAIFRLIPEFLSKFTIAFTPFRVYNFNRI